jgi:osmotically-inducible protein OsmY
MVQGVTQTMHRSDQVLQATVSDQLLFTPSVDSHLTVAVTEGVVLLEGDVASVAERRAATKTAGRVWGVKAVTNHTVVRSAGASGADDTDLARVATSMLDWSVDVPANTVTAEVHDRKITLNGVVTWQFQREAAARAVRYLRGITAVTNKITINESPSVSIVKDGLEAAIRRTMPMLAPAITVDVDGHALTLRGNVRSSAQRRQVEHLAWATAGVSSVDNNLVIGS